MMLIQQMPEFQQCCCIRSLFIDEVDSKKASRFVFRRPLEYSMLLNDCCFMQLTIPVSDISIIQNMVIRLNQKC